VRKGTRRYSLVEKFIVDEGYGEGNYFDRVERYYSNIKAAMERQKGLIKMVEESLAIIEKEPGVLQKDLYSRFPSEHKSGLSGVFRDLEGEGFLVRTKKSSTYQLTLAKPAVDVLARVKKMLLS
jgi:hypothetical protein